MKKDRPGSGVSLSSSPTGYTSTFPLSALSVGRSAVVDEVTDPENPVSGRLSDLGFLPGTPVRAVRRAPLQDPTIYELRGNRMGLRRAEAQRIRVRFPAEGS